MRQTLARRSLVNKQRDRKLLRYLLWAIFVLVTLFVGLGLLSHMKSIVLDDVQISGNEIVDAGEVRQQILESLEGNNLLVYAKGNVFLFSKDQIEEYVLGHFPRVYKVLDIKRDGKTLAVSIEERKSAYLWCGFDVPTYDNQIVGKECFFLDQKGFIFDHAPFFTNGVYLTVYGGITAGESPIGQVVGLRNSMENISRLADLFASHDLPIHSLVIKDDGQNEFLLDIRTTTGDYAKIIFNEDETVEELLKKVETALSDPEFTASLKENRVRLEYIDTRFKNKLFYKFRS